MIYTDLFVRVSHLQLDSPLASKAGFVLDPALTAVQMNIQPADKAITALIGGMYGSAFTGFTTCSGIIDGDMITVSGTGEQYAVKGTNNFNYLIGQHLEVLLEKILV